MSPKYRILKLQSGEEIIARITKREKGKISLELPMCFRTMVMGDPYTGAQKEITILKDWVSYTSDKYVKIPETLVVSYSSPLTEAVALYEKEKEKKEKNKGKREIKNLDSFKKDVQSEMQDFINQMMNQIGAEGTPEEDVDKAMSDLFGGLQGGQIEWEFEMEFPSEEISGETTEEETNHPDYGNRWTDWSEDPRNY